MTAAPSPAPAGTARVAASRTKWWSSSGCWATRNTADTAIQAPSASSSSLRRSTTADTRPMGTSSAGRRSPVERVQKHSLDVVGHRGAEAACVTVVRDDGLPQLAERARVGDEQHRPDRERSRGGGGRCPPRAAGDEQDRQRRDDRKGEQLDGDRRSGKHAHGRPPPRATAGVEGDRDRAERQGDRSRVRLDARGLHGPGRGDGEQRGGAERSPDARELPADRVGGDQPEERDEHECDADPLDTVARQQRQPLEQHVEAGRLRRVDVRPQLLSVPQGVERCEVDALVVVRSRLDAADVHEPRDREQRGEPEPGPTAHGTVTVTGFERRKTSPSSGSSTQFAAAPTLYVHVPGPGRSVARVRRVVRSSGLESVQRPTPSRRSRSRVWSAQPGLRKSR